MKPDGFFSNFSINNPNKYVLYLSGLSFLISLFDVNGIDNSLVRVGAIKFIVAGLIIWSIQSILQMRIDYLIEGNDKLRDRQKDEIIAWIVFQWFILFFIYFIVGIMVF